MYLTTRAQQFYLLNEYDLFVKFETKFLDNISM